MNALMELEEVAHEHLLMHFTRNGAFGPGRQPVLVLERGEGPYVFDTHGNRYFDALSALFCSHHVRRLTRRPAALRSFRRRHGTTPVKFCRSRFRPIARPDRPFCPTGSGTRRRWRARTPGIP